MKLRTSTALVSTVALIGAGASLLPAAASPSHRTHKLSFTAVTEKSVMFTKRSGAESDKNLNKKGKIIGFGDLSFKVGKTGGTGRIALDLAGGFMYGKLTISPSPVTHGTLTGGTGKYKGVTGKILATNLNQAGTKTAVVITYH
jgi:hypothetical protein